MDFTNSRAFEAATRNGYRGYFWFPDLDPAYQMDSYSRQTIAEKSNWLYNNMGAVRAVIDGLALDEVDTGLWPKPHTNSRAFNAAVKALWQQQCGFHKSFSADGENNFYSAQFAIRREIRLRGGCFGQKLRAGEAAACPQLQLLPDWQCRNASTSLDQSLWVDGLRRNQFGRNVQYRFVTNRTGTAWRDVDAADAIHFHDPFLIGQRRGMPALAPVARKLFTVDDIERAKSGGVLLRTRIAYGVERKSNDDGDGPSLLPGAEVEVVPQDDGSKIIIQKVRISGDTELEIADPGAGRKIYAVESAKSDEAGPWTNELLADVAYATLYPREYIFSLAGLTQGTLVRMAQQKVQRVVNTIRDFQIILQLLDEWWPFWLWQNIKAGNLDNVRGGIPDEWWPYIIVRPRDMTVDMGREGRLYDDRIATGKMPSGLYVGMLYGEDEDDFEDAIIRDAYRRQIRNREIAKELRDAGEEIDDIPLDNIFRPPTGGPTPTAADPALEDDPTPPTPPPTPAKE